MKVVFDNIIFSLQKSGGISKVWKELLSRTLNQEILDSCYVEFDDASNNFFRKQLFLKNKILKNSNALIFLKRYFDLKILSEDKCIFHSSYYRIASGKNIINITTVHDFTYEYFFKGIAQKIHTWQKKRAILKSDGIICISESTKKDLLHFFPQIQDYKIRVIYNGVDDNFEEIDKNIPFTKNHFFEDFSYSIYVGDHKSKYKNFDLAIEACRLQNMKLLIIGGGELTKKEIFLLDCCLGKNNYKLLLNVDNYDLNQYYNRAFCLIYPSYYEGFGIPILEAQKAGCPVIATFSSSIPEVIADITFAIKDPTPEKISIKMRELKLNSDIRKNIIQLGKEKAKLFNWDKTYSETIEFYKDLFK